jgi:negative regulator of sigma E activity
VHKILGSSAEPAADKARIIASWPQAEQERRRRFLETVNAWVASI